MNDKGVSITAPAKPGLLNILRIILIDCTLKVVRLTCFHLYFMNELKENQLKHLPTFSHFLSVNVT